MGESRKVKVWIGWKLCPRLLFSNARVATIGFLLMRRRRFVRWMEGYCMYGMTWKC